MQTSIFISVIEIYKLKKTDITFTKIFIYPFYEDERKFNIMVRYESSFRRSEEEIGKILVPARDGTMVPIKEPADIRTITGLLIIYRENHTRFCTVKFSVRGRDMGTAVAGGT